MTVLLEKIGRIGGAAVRVVVVLGEEVIEKSIGGIMGERRNLSRRWLTSTRRRLRVSRR